MYYSDELVEEIRSKSDVLDIISGYVRLQKKGSSYFGLCPFHNEKSPSFSVTPSKQMFYCFGCHAGGNVFTFVQKYENFTFPEALKMLAERAGVNLPEAEYTEEMKKRESRRQQLLDINKEAAKYFYYQLRAPQGQQGYEYLMGRKLSEETLKKFGLGYANKTSDDLVRYLKEKGFEDTLIQEAGLASFDERYGFHDKFWNRVMFPISDVNGKVIGFGGRVMGDGKPKYLNSPETLVFDKSRNLYGLNIARTSRKNQFILCEGYMDVITMHQAGFTQAVASLGTAFTSQQANLLSRYAKEVLLAYDSDGAGTAAAVRAIRILRDAGLTGKVIRFDPYKDPDEFIKAEGAEAFQKRLDEAENSFLFEIRILQTDFDLSDPAGKTNFCREIAKKLCTFTEELERENYLEAVARTYNISADQLRKLVVAYAASEGDIKPIERPKSGIQKKKTPEDTAKRLQRLMITWLTEKPYLYPRIKTYISAEDFTEPMYRRVAEKLFEGFEAGGTGVSPGAIINMFENEEEQQAAAELFHTNLEAIESPKDQEKAFHDILMGVKKNSNAYYTTLLGSDVSALGKMIESKKTLEMLANTKISILP